MITVRRAKAADAAALATSLRAADAAETAAFGFKRAQAALEASVKNSTLAWYACLDAEPLALWGLRPDSLLGPGALAWCLSGRAAEKCKKSFYRISQNVLRLFLTLYPVVYCWSDARYVRAHKWLKRLGARQEGASGDGKLLLFVFRREYGPLKR